jgi:hypothetical protein
MSITIDVPVPYGEFYYLAGPMTGYPQHNFPEFQRVSEKLTKAHYTICSPADLDAPIYDEVMDGDGTQEHLRSDAPVGLALLRRDVNIVMHPRCVGVICLKGWEDSFGAQIETFIAKRFKRPIYLFIEDAWIRPEDTAFVLMEIDRDEAIKHHENSKLLEAMREAPPLPESPYRVGRLELDPLGLSRSQRTLGEHRPGLDIPRGRRAV